MNEIEKKLSELEEKVKQLLSISQVGDDVRQELEKVKLLKSNGVEIPHLEKQFAEQLYPTRKQKNRVILQSELEEAINRTSSYRQAAKILGVHYLTLKKYTKLYNIHNPKGWPVKKGAKKGPISPNLGKYPINDVLEGKWPEFPVHRLKDKLIRSGIKKAACEICGYSERRLTDGKMPLLLNFEDGNKKNHKLENLKMLCYNCTFTCGKGYISRGPKYFDPDLLQDGKKILKQRF